ncbi:hypothetical protein [Microvirga lotononidis]|uniref:Uncharacterized protein n=1 Tax=Microvirga lotononidis TaxID=864069 RepID=I4YRD5_9HYPH|nr:hypothetical protein [Microvirga lotononidis]EIM26527.1 hypothetical protein MicloDRAFT_00030760 [Microvirga lotononidis]WQO31211.1 hypothetical protein U0023_33465 [Microvirga lotononidis]
MRLKQITMIVALAVAWTSPVLAQQQKLPPGYTLNPTLMYKNVAQDPDGIWSANDLVPVGSPAQHPDIAIARVSTPAGEWILSQILGGCSMQSDCPFRLILKRSNGKAAKVAGGVLAEGGTAVLSADYSKIFTETYSGVETNPVEVPK